MQVNTSLANRGYYHHALLNIRSLNLHLPCSSFNSGSHRRIKLGKTIQGHGSRVHNQVNFIDASPQLAPTTQISSSTTAATLPALWPELAERYGDAVALLDPHASPPAQYTFDQLSTTISTFARGLSSLGLAPGDKVSLFSENSCRWLITDQAIQSCGAVDAVRGVSSTVEELSYIMQHSESSALFVQDLEILKKLSPVLSSAPLATKIRFVVVLWENTTKSEKEYKNESTVPMPVYSFNEVLQKGEAATTSLSSPSSSVLNSDSLATLVYTSGTTGSPKGVQLTHSNILYQVKHFPAFLNVQPGSKALSILPPWHIYERTVSYHILSRGACQVYSTIRHFKEDLSAYPPDFLVCVPLVLDSLRSRVLAALKKASVVRKTLALTLLSVAISYTRAQRIINGVSIDHAMHAAPAMVLFKAWLVSIFFAPLNWLAQKLVTTKIKAALGVKQCVVSGGGSLAPHLDDFFEAVELPVLNGYGLTETSPVLACRSMNSFSSSLDSNTTTNTSSDINGANCRGSVGRPIPETEIKIVNPENLQEIYPDGRQGLILVKGPGVMKGYYNNESATAAAFAAGEGWFDTGDLGWIVPSSQPSIPRSGASDKKINISNNFNKNRMAGCLVLTGRAKDTIVLSSGENVEPQPLEDAICASPYIKFSALVGHGHRSLGALLVPDTDALAELEKKSSSFKSTSSDTSLTAAEINKIMKEAVSAACANRVAWERVTAFKVLEKPFSVEDGTLTKTMKPRRAVIHQVYAAEIAELEKKLR